jgi:hypothetical protein
MTVQQWFRGRGFDGAIGPVALSRSVAISLPPDGLGRTLVAVGGGVLLVALALWASAGTAVVAVGVGVTAWGWQRAQQRKRPDLARDELAPFWSPVRASAAASGSLRSPGTLPALLTAETGLTRPQAQAELLPWCTDPAALPVRVLAGVAGQSVRTLRGGEVSTAALPGRPGRSPLHRDPALGSRPAPRGRPGTRSPTPGASSVATPRGCRSPVGAASTGA